MIIPPPDPNELIPNDAFARLKKAGATNLEGKPSNVFTEANNAMNTLRHVQGLRRYILSGESNTQSRAAYEVHVPAILPDKLNIHGLEEINDARGALSGRLTEIEQIQQPDEPHPTKAYVHQAFNAAFACFDPEPTNVAAKHFRDMLQQAAAILDLPHLGQDHARRAGTSQSRDSRVERI